MEYDKVIAYLLSIATLLHLATSTMKNIKDMRKDKKKRSTSQPSRKRKKKNR